MVKCYYRTYSSYEKRANTIESITELKLEYSQEHEKKPDIHYTKLDTYKALNYAVMRDLFMHPSYFPKYNEYDLLGSFDFSQYLILTLDGTLSSIVEFTTTTMLFLVCALSAWILLLSLIAESQFFIMSGFPLLFIIVAVGIEHSSNMIQIQLNPDLSDPTNIKFSFEGSNNQPKHVPIYYNKPTGNPYINSHQALFCCGPFGIQLMRYALQIIYYFSVFWIAVYAGYHFTGISKKWYHYLIFAVAIILYLLFILLFLHRAIKAYSVITNIQMMKKRHIIDKVISKFENETIAHQVGIYKVIKLIYREIINPDKEDLNDILQNKLQGDVIALNCGFDRIPISQFQTLVRLSGQKVSKLEKHIFMKKCKCNGESISYLDLVSTINGNIKDDYMQPHVVIIEVLTTLFSADSSVVNMDQLLKLFEEYKSYFDEADYEYNRMLIYAISANSAVDIQQYASAISVNMEIYPK